MDTVLLKCQSCSKTNKVSKENLHKEIRCGNCKSVIKIFNSPINITAQSFKAQVLDMPGNVLIMFFSPNCTYCHKLSPVLDIFAREQAGIVRVVKVNTLDESELAGSFQIMGVPTLMLYKDGKQIKRISGAMSKEQLENWVFS